MANVSISKRPSGTVASLSAPKRDGNRYECTWSIPSSMTSGSNAARTTWLGTKFILRGKRGAKDFELVSSAWSHMGKSRAVNINSFQHDKGVFDAKKTTQYTRADFYPLANRFLTEIEFTVRGWNDYPKSHWAEKAATVKRAFLAPRKPTISAPSRNRDTGRVSATIKTDAGADYRERYDTQYKLTVYDSRTRKTSVVRDGTSTSTEFSTSWDVADQLSLTYSEFIRYTFRARSRGLAGASDWVERQHVVAYPALPGIKTINCSSREGTGQCIIGIRTNAKADHPVDSVELETLVDVDYADAADIPADADWRATDLKDDAKCTALAIAVSEVIPQPGKYTWVRIKAVHDEIFIRNSEPKRIKALETPAPTAEDDPVKVISATPAADGESISVLLGWNKGGRDDATGTELSWSTDEDAWISTDLPSTYEFTRDDGPHESYESSATVVIKGLTNGEAYYVRARRYLESDSGTSFGEYGSIAAVIPTESPTSVVLAAPAYIAEGDSLPLTWTYDTDAVQRSWQAVTDGGVVIGEGEDPLGAASIEWDRLAPFVEDGALTVRLAMDTGGDPVVSDSRTIRISSYPACDLTVPAQVAAQPAQIGIATDRGGCTATVIVSAAGAQGQRPDRVATQASGDTIWSAVVEPEWAESEGTYGAQVAIPQGSDLWEGCAYTVTASVIDGESGLVSAQQTGTFTVAWEHTAPAPPDDTVITASVQSAEGGVQRRADIALGTGGGLADTDVLDVYRIGLGRYDLIASGLAPGDTVTDMYAPYGPQGLAYRIATRTADGDVDFDDFAYELAGECVRIDYAGDGPGYVELFHNLKLKTQVEKDFEARKHLDGQVRGYWNEGAEKSVSIGATVDRAADPDLFRALCFLAEAPGAAFVRTPEGDAFMANVQVSGLDSEVASAAEISIDCERIAAGEPYLAEFDEGPEEG